MDRIYVKDLLTGGSYPEAGTKFYALAYPSMQQGQTIYVDMTDVTAIPTTFMNVSFGQMIKEYGKQQAKERLKFLNITKSQLERIKRYFDTYE